MHVRLTKHHCLKDFLSSLHCRVACVLLTGMIDSTGIARLHIVRHRDYDSRSQSQEKVGIIIMLLLPGYQEFVSWWMKRGQRTSNSLTTLMTASGSVWRMSPASSPCARYKLVSDGVCLPRGSPSTPTRSGYFLG